MRRYLGALSGSAFGIAGFFLATLGLISIVAEIASPLLFPIAALFRAFQLNFPGMLLLAVLLNGALFGAFGHAMQGILRHEKKNEALIAYAFGAIVLFIVALIFAEALLRGLSP